MDRDGYLLGYIVGICLGAYLGYTLGRNRSTTVAYAHTPGASKGVKNAQRRMDKHVSELVRNAVSDVLDAREKAA